MTKAMKAYQERLITLVRDTVTLLCKNGLDYSQEFSVEGLLGVTLDKDEVFLIPIKELVADKGIGTTDTPGGDSTVVIAEGEENGRKSPKRERKKRRREREREFRERESARESAAVQDEGSVVEWTEGNDQTGVDDVEGGEPVAKKPHHRERSDVNVKEEDIVVIKEEVGEEEFGDVFQQDTTNMQNPIQHEPGDNNMSMNFLTQASTSQDNMSFQGEQFQGLPEGLVGSLAAAGDSSWLQQSQGVAPSTPRADGSQDPYQKHQCVSCNKTFCRKDTLRRHMNTQHLGVRHPCDLCEKSYTQKHDLKRHRLLAHEVDPSEPVTGVLGVMQKEVAEVDMMIG